MYDNFLPAQKQIEVSPELLDTLNPPFNTFHMCISLVGRQLLASRDIRYLGNVLESLNSSSTKSLFSFCLFINEGVSRDSHFLCA
jgi:hypothetical protein